MKSDVKVKKDNVSVRHSIGLKLAFCIGLLVVLSLGVVTFLVSYLITTDTRVTAEDNNLTLNSRSASAVENELKTIRSNVFQLLDMTTVIGGGRSAALYHQTQAFFFERNENIAAIIIAEEKTDSSKDNVLMVNNKFFIANELEVSLIDDFIIMQEDIIKRCSKGETAAVNASPCFGLPLLSLVFPWAENGRDQCCMILFSTETFTDSLSLNRKSTTSTFMVNKDGDLLLHQDTDLVKGGVSYSNYPLVKAMWENNDQDRQIVFKDADGIEHFGAYHRIKMADLGIMTIIPTDKVFEAINKTTRNNIYLTAAILCVAIMFILIYTHFSISKPLKLLKKAVEEITTGNFNNDYVDALNIRRKDEIGILNKGTQDEKEFLNTFAKFTNQNVAKAIASKTLDFDPHLKDLTIFFSDIRGFTAISNGFKEKFKEQEIDGKRYPDTSAAEIIGFLNDYMGRMVNCVTLSHGNIDKFEGDAIMGLWGIMRNDDVEKIDSLPENSPEKIQHRKHVQEDAINAISGIIAMRYALMEYNKAAEAYTEEHKDEFRGKYKPHIKIGCGLNTGRATAGIMGSADKMEYTAIGDAVNFASRTEASNKACGTDILITEDTYNLIKNEYIRLPENNFTIPEENSEREIVVEKIPVSFEVKGKGEQHFYGVVNMPAFDIEKFFKAGDPDFKVDPDCACAVGPAGPKSMKEVRQLLGIPTPDFEKVNLNEEENKIQIKK